MCKQIWILVVCGFVASAAHAQSDPVRMTCVGNSITEGAGTNNPVYDAYPIQLGALLGPGWQVKNSGVSGRTMLRHGDYPIWVETRFKEGIDFNPNLVTITLGTNDSKPWNWVYKNEFVPDYSAMIDTFAALPAHPAVWLCLPPPSFSDAFSIRDSIITTDIIPMIQQLAQAKGCPLVDFYTPLIDQSRLFPDGIHPNNEGAAVMAKILYQALTGKTITQTADENVSAGKPVEVSGSVLPSLFGGGNLVDEDNLSYWKALGFPSQAVVDLGAAQSVDLFRLDFGADAGAGFQFKIETAVDASAWSLAIDRTSRTDTAAVLLERTEPISARYVRLTVTGAVHPKGDTVSVAELRVLKENGGPHAPAVTARMTRSTRTYSYFDLTLISPNAAGSSMMLYKKAGADGSFTSATGYRSSSSTVLSKEVVRNGTVNEYYAVAFHEGVEVASDTMTIDLRTTEVEEAASPTMPTRAALLPAYPNPFNPSTTITFELTTAAKVSLRVYDVMGRFVATLAEGPWSAGVHRVSWEAEDETGRVLPSGVYVVRMEASSERMNQKVLLVR